MDRLGAKVSANSPWMDEGPWADEITIGTLPLEPGQEMKLTYDFGDNWQFKVKLERIEATDPKSKKPRILEKAKARHPNNIRAGTSEPATSSTSRARKRLMGRKR